jgi:cation:H+ antiporter
VSDALLALMFVLAAAISLATSWLLVSRLERIGARLGLSEALLGLLAALAADAPEITAAVTALAHHDGRVGAGVVIGSNVFNLAALLGLSAIVAGRIALHRRVIELSGAVALWVALVTLLVVTAVLTPLAGLLLALAVVAPYVAILGIGAHRLGALRLPAAWTRWLAAAVEEEELELASAVHPDRGGRRDTWTALGAVALVVAASIVMEQSAAKLGVRHGVPEVIVGALVLAGVTSLPNAVAAMYLARRGRGAAVLSTSLNSNVINVLAGLLIPTTIIGIAGPSGQTTFVAAAYLGMTALALGCAYASHGLRRGAGWLIVAAYALFVAVLLAAS